MHLNFNSSDDIFVSLRGGYGDARVYGDANVFEFEHLGYSVCGSIEAMH